MGSGITGKMGEQLAAEYMRKKGYKILDAGYYSRYGEIDIVAQKGKTVAFIEVKTRKNSAFANAFENVNHKKQEKLKITANAWIGQYDKGYIYRFDVIEVYTEQMQINHIENAFQ